MRSTRSDFWAGQAWGRRGANCYLLRSVRGRWDLVEGTQQVRDLYGWARQLFPGVRLSVLIENAAAGPDVIGVLKNEVPGVIPVTPKGEKVQRVFAVTPPIEAGNVWLPGAASPDGTYDKALTPAWVQDFLIECAGFPNGANDDQVDAMSQALLRLTTSHEVTATIRTGERGRPRASRHPVPAPSPYSSADLRALEAQVAAHGSHAVTTIKRLADPSFQLPDHLRHLAPRGTP